MEKKILITWHFTSYGIGFLKNILGAFYKGLVADDKKEGLHASGLVQMEMHSAFDAPIAEKGFLFDQIYFLTVGQDKWDTIATRHNSVKQNLLVDPLLEGNLEMKQAWERICQGDFTNLEQDRRFIKEHYPAQLLFFESILWRTIHCYSVEDQIHWFTQASNAAPYYCDKLNIVAMDQPAYGLNDLRDPVGATKSLRHLITKLREEHPHAQFYIKVSLAIFELEVGWYLLAESNYLPNGTRFFMSYDRKDTTEKTIRFRHFYIKEVPTAILNTARENLDLFDAPLSKDRELANKKMAYYMKAGFAILLLGERGTGKSYLAQKFKGQKENFAVANCGAFDDDLRAEEQLFGYIVKYRRSNRNREVVEEKSDGLFQQAHGGVLFLDDIHYLSRQVQARLMRALETDTENFFRIRRVGQASEEKIKCKVIMASNRSLSELKRVLLPDFYDRIVQNVIVMPSLANSRKDREKDWESIWIQMRFGKDGDVPRESELLNWLANQPFPGNFRDLQKVAIYYYSYRFLFDDETRSLSGLNSPYAFARAEFENYHQLPEVATHYNYSDKMNAEEMVAGYQKEMVKWAIARTGSNEEAWKILNISRRTFYLWKGEKKPSKTIQS